MRQAVAAETRQWSRGLRRAAHKHRNGAFVASALGVALPLLAAAGEAGISQRSLE